MDRKKVNINLELIVPRDCNEEVLLLLVKGTINTEFYKLWGEQTGVEKIKITQPRVLSSSTSEYVSLCSNCSNEVMHGRDVILRGKSAFVCDDYFNTLFENGLPKK